MEEITVMDPACGSGNFLLYAMDFYTRCISIPGHREHTPEDSREQPLWIDIDERAIQLTALSLFTEGQNLSRKSRPTRSNLSHCLDHFRRVRPYGLDGDVGPRQPGSPQPYGHADKPEKTQYDRLPIQDEPAGKKRRWRRPALMETFRQVKWTVLYRGVNTIEEKLPAQTDAVLGSLTATMQNSSTL